MPARQVLLDRYAITFCDAPAASEGGSSFGDDAHVFVAEDARRGAHALVAAHVATAHTGGLDLQQRGVYLNLGERKFAQLGCLRRHLHVGQH